MLSYPVSWGITAVLFVDLLFEKKFPKAENEKKKKIIKNTESMIHLFNLGIYSKINKKVPEIINI